MDAPARRRDSADAASADPTLGAEQQESIVTCHETSPGRIVFTERKNTDGWIASDLVLDLEP